MARLSRGKRRLGKSWETADRLHSAAIHLLRHLRRQDVRTGVGPAQLSALSVLVFAGPRTLGELARAEQVKAPTMTHIVAGLQRRGLVRRERDATDRRVVRVRATPKGVRVMQAGRRPRIALLAARFRRLDPREVAALRRAASIMEEMFEHPARRQS